MMRVGMLTSGGDCQALNATMRGVAKTLYNADPDTQIFGFEEGYRGLMYNDYILMKPNEVGKLAAERAAAKGISTVAFDRNGYLYHGRVKQLAEAAREGGLKF